MSIVNDNAIVYRISQCASLSMIKIFYMYGVHIIS